MGKVGALPQQRWPDIRKHPTKLWMVLLQILMYQFQVSVVVELRRICCVASTLPSAPRLQNLMRCSSRALHASWVYQSELHGLACLQRVKHIDVTIMMGLDMTSSQKLT